MNTNLIHADTFFFVSTILLSVFGVIFIVAILYLIKILREVRAIASTVRMGTEKLAADIELVREKIHSTGLGPQAVISLLGTLWKKKSTISRGLSGKRKK